MVFQDQFLPLRPQGSDPHSFAKLTKTLFWQFLPHLSTIQNGQIIYTKGFSLNIPLVYKAADLPEDTFGQCLRKWRIINGIDVATVASDIGTHTETIMRWERGYDQPNAKNKQHIENFINQYNITKGIG